ncbi:uncharacterized protein ATC70_007294 [Mucor velutinosus]|uniref:Uncharacterized protein n=1 Tax=Mucor velutinosus TaxID=708070 RepID=A0AAN7D9W7_9FUNG|nr:hypothetical protein ATC70_007294 [Mucor velutinosus]
MQGQPNGHPYAENVVPTTEQPTHSFSSDLVFLPPSDASQYIKTELPPLQSANSEAPSSFVSATLKRKRSVMSKLFRHNHGLVYRLGKEKNVFLQRFSSEEDEGLCTVNMDNENRRIAVREIYTIANGYNIYSLHYPPQWPAKSWNLNRQHVSGDVSQSPFIASIVHSWKYDQAKQVYASKAVDELKEIVNEYHVWLQKTTATLVDVTLVAPRLCLEWPKNWAFSTV